MKLDSILPHSLASSGAPGRAGQGRTHPTRPTTRCHPEGGTGVEAAPNTPRKNFSLPYYNILHQIFRKVGVCALVIPPL